MGHYRCGVVADVFLGAIVVALSVCGLVSRGLRLWSLGRENHVRINVQDAITKSTKRDHGISILSSICQFYFQHSDIVNDRSGNGSYKEKNRRREEEKCADMVKESGCHFDG